MPPSGHQKDASVKSGRKSAGCNPGAERSRKGSEGKGVTAAPGPEEQVALFERATALFRKGKFTDAQALFEQAAQGPNRSMAHSAAVHAQVCIRKVAEPDPVLETAESHYDYGVALLNSRELEKAEKHLRKALSGSGQHDHVHYALALCRALQGDLAGAGDELERALEIDPRTRMVALHDPEFQPWLNRSPIREILKPGGPSSD